MADEYAQRYVNALIEVAVNDPNAVEIIGEIGAETAKQPHVAVYLQLGPGHYLATTAGVSVKRLSIDRGLQHFELCALTTGHAPSLLTYLSELAMFIVSAQPKVFLPFEAMEVSKDERLLLVPRWKFLIPEGPPVEVVEPLPLSTEDWNEVGPLSLDDRAKWARALGLSSPQRWKALFPKL